MRAMMITLVLLLLASPCLRADAVTTIGAVRTTGEMPQDRSIPFTPDSFEGLPATRAGFEKIAGALLEFYTERGYPFAQVCIEDLKLGTEGTMDVTMRIVAGPLSVFDTCMVTGIDPRTAEYLVRISSVAPGEPFSSEAIETSKRVFRSHRFLSVDDSVELLFRGDFSKCIPVFKLQRLPTNFIEGSLGYQPAYGSQSAYVRGFARLEFENLFGRGRRFSIRYNKKDPFSHEVNLGYYQPFVFYRPLSIAFDLGQLQFDSLYQKISCDSRIEYGRAGNASVRISGGWSRYTPRGLIFRGIYHSRRWAWGVGSTISLDFAGASHTFDLDISYGSKRQYRFAGVMPENTRIADTRLEGQYEFRTPLTGPLHQRSTLSGRAIVTDETVIPPSDLYKLGGLQNLRGYREDQFFCERYVLGTIQPCLLMTTGAELHLFSDLAWLRQSPGEALFRYGIGTGFEFTLPTGKLVLDLAWGRDDSFRDGKLYAILESRF